VRAQEPDEWLPPSAEVKQLQALIRRIEVLEEMRQAEENRLANAASEVQPSIERMIALLKKEITEFERQIKEHIDKHPNLKEQSRLLETIPGKGFRTAHLLLSEIEVERYSSARSIAAQAGVTPRKRQSGTSLKQTSLSRTRQRATEKGGVFSGDSSAAA